MLKRFCAMLTALVLCISIAGCSGKNASKQANQLPNAPWGASIEEVEKHYDLTHVEWTEEQIQSSYGNLRVIRNYKASKELFGYDTDIVFGFFYLENESGEANSYLFAAKVYVQGLTPKEAMATYKNEEGNILKNYIHEVDKTTPTEEQMARYERNRNLVSEIGFWEPSNIPWIQRGIKQSENGETYDLSIFYHAEGYLATIVEMEYPK